jgi:hypothetical protein
VPAAYLNLAIFNCINRNLFFGLHSEALPTIAEKVVGDLRVCKVLIKWRKRVVVEKSLYSAPSETNRLDP